MKPCLHSILLISASIYLTLKMILKGIVLQDAFFAARNLYPNVNSYSGIILLAIVSSSRPVSS